MNREYFRQFISLWLKETFQIGHLDADNYIAVLMVAHQIDVRYVVWSKCYVMVDRHFIVIIAIYANKDCKNTEKN